MTEMPDNWSRFLVTSTNEHRNEVARCYAAVMDDGSLTG